MTDERDEQPAWIENTPGLPPLVRNILIFIMVLALLTLLAAGRIDAVMLLLMPLVFLIFGRHPDRRREP